MSSTPSTIILITGANSGIGYAAAKVIADASENYHVIIAGRSLEKVKAAEDEIKSSGIKGHVSSLQLDITDKKSIDAAVKEVENQFGHLDVFVANAAIYSQNPDLRTDLTDTFTTNVIGTAVSSAAFQPLLEKSKNGYLLFISSGLGSLAFSEDKSRWDSSFPALSYRMSKAALNMLTIESHKTLESKGVKVFAVCPGFVVSNLRGTSEEARNGGGKAGDPMVSGQTILSIMEGKRDANVGKFVHKDGVYPW